MKRIALAAVLALALAPLGIAQASNDGFLSLTVNGTVGGGTSPIAASIVVPNTLTLDIDGTPMVPFALGIAPGVAVGTIVVAPISIDVGPAPQLLLNGISPVQPLDFFGFIGAGGNTQFNLPLNGNLLPGVLGGFQAISVDATAPGGVADSAATEVSLIAPFDFGSITYFKGGTLNHDMTSGIAGVGTASLGVPSVDFDIEGYNLNHWGEFVSTASNSIYWQRDPAVVGPQSVANNTTFDYINTIHGRLYQFQDLTVTPNTFGYMFASPGGAAPVVLTDTVMTNGTSTTSPWEFEVAMSPDQSTMAAVFDPSTGTDQVFLIKLDGTTFASTGTGVVNVTPGAANPAILEESLRFSNSHIYFVDGTATGNFFSAPIDGSAAAAFTALPLTGVGLPVTLTDGENRYHAASDTVFIQAGNGTTTEDIFAISHPGGVQTITNITNFAMAREIEEFGDANDGNDGQFAISPDGSRCCFITVESVDDELYWVTTDGLGTPAILSDPTVFDTAIDDIIELNFYNNDHIMAFAGTTTAVMDLYDFDISLAPALTLTNVTQTNGQDGTLLPIAASPTASIDPDGLVLLSDRMLFARDGTQTLGMSAGSSVFNLVGVPYATLVPYDILGDEFGATTAQFGIETTNTILDLTFAPTLDFGYFKSGLGLTANDEDLHGFDANTLNHSDNLTSGMVGGSLLDNIVTDPSGVTVAFSWNVGGDEEVYQAFFAVPASASAISSVAGATTDIGDASINFTDSAAPVPGIIFSAGANSSTNPSDANLIAIDLFAFLVTVIDSDTAVHHIASISYP